MARIQADRVAELATTTGTGAFTLAGALTGFRAFSAVCATSDTLSYTIELIDGSGAPLGEWETGTGTYSGANTLTRTTVVASSNAGAAVNFAAGTKRVYISSQAALNPTETIVVAVGDETTAITTGTAKVTFRMPYAFTVTAVRASLTTVSSSGLPTIDINDAGVSILSTAITIDASEKTSTTAATPAVISDASLADDAEMTIDIDVAGTGAAGLKVYIIGYRT